MKVLRPIWLDKDLKTVRVIDQRRLPHEHIIRALRTVADTAQAIKNMTVRGAPLIGVTGAYGMYLAALAGDDLKEAGRIIKAARPTAVNLFWAVDTVLAATQNASSREEKIQITRSQAERITEFEVENCRQIGLNGLGLIEAIAQKKGGDTVNILTHCNAGWLACVEYGTATAPIYAAHETGTNVHVWVDETRPLNQGARLTAWELEKAGVPHTVICDNAGGHLMQHQMVDIVLVGSDRATAAGDAANKIGTYLKALAAKDNNIPFYVALPSSTFDWNIKDGLQEIPIEARDADEVRFVDGFYCSALVRVRITPEKSRAANPAFDVTPARLITGFITERGVCEANEADIRRLFPDLSVKPEAQS